MTARLVIATLLGIAADLLGMGDAFPYAHRMKGFNPLALTCMIMALLVIPAILSFGTGSALRITAYMLAGMTLVHTAVLIIKTSRDPTSHNLFPFEYVIIAFFGVPVLLGAGIGQFLSRFR